ncbi:hypothetical protein PM082_023995 [Marasmius tenuissimus]|nr:hypothetical protein PM082_023995 [Marasmius tenuissimus]
MIQEIKAVQKKGQRKRTFKAAVAQLKKFAEYLQNRYNIHLWAILAGGQIRSNQLYTFVCGLHESAGFAKGVRAVGEDDIGELFQAWIFDRNAAKFTNQQIAAMAHVRGLKVTGPGIDEEMGPPATATPPAQPSSPAPSIKVHSTTRTGAPGKKVKKENVHDVIRDVVKKRFAECMETLNKLFKGTNLLWSTLAAEWNSASKSPTIHRGYTIRGQTSTARPIVVSTVYPQITNSIELKNNKVPVLVTAPNSKGEVVKIFHRDIDSLSKKKVKFEVDDSLPPASSSSRIALNRSAKNKQKPDYGNKDIEGDKTDMVPSEEEPLKPSSKSLKGTSNGLRKRVRNAQSASGTPSPSKKGSTTSRTTTSPLTSIEDEASLSSPSALTTPKAGPSKNLKPITMDEFRNGGFSSLDPALLKRPATSKSTGEGPPNKKAAKQGSEAS